MLRAFSLTLIVLMAVFAGCVSESNQKDVPDASPGVPKLGAELPPVYVSDGQRLAQNYSAPDFPRMVEVLTGGRGAEPNMGVTSTGSIFVTAFDQTLRSQDGGRTWKVVYDFASPNPVGQDLYDTADPMLWVDSATDRIFTNHMFPVLVCSSQIISDDDGESWIHVPGSCGSPVVDHQKLATAPFHAPLMP